MARFDNHDDIGTAALYLAEEVRYRPPLELYRRLAHQCRRDPERMAQVLLCLAVWLDVDAPISSLTARAEAIGNNRVEVIGRRMAAL